MIDARQEALAWQTGVWDRISGIYVHEIDRRFEPVVRHTVERAKLRSGESVLDLGTGTGAAAMVAAAVVGSDGSVVGVDLSPEMLAAAERRRAAAGARNVTLREGRAEEIPAADEEFDAIVSSLCLMYAIDREAAAYEVARVLKPGGRLSAAVWGGPEHADIVRFQATAGKFAPAPPVPGVGPGALADAEPFLAQLRSAGFDVALQTETVTWEFPSFEVAWDVLAGVTTAALEPEGIAEAKAAVRALMWPDPAAPRTFTNLTQLIVATKAR